MQSRDGLTFKKSDVTNQTLRLELIGTDGSSHSFKVLGRQEPAGWVRARKHAWIRRRTCGSFAGNGRTGVGDQQKRLLAI